MDEPERAEPRPMSPFAAVGWTLGVTFAWVFLLTALGSLKHNADATNLDLVTRGGCQVAAYLLGLFLILRVHAPEASIRRFVALRGTHPLFYAVAPLLAVTVKALVDVVYDLIVKKWPTGDEGIVESMIADASPAKRVAFLVVVALVGPAVEELFFRGALVQGLRKANPIPVVVVVLAGVFALAHIEWQAFLPLALCGAALVGLRLASGSLVPGFVMHAVFNGVTFLEVLRQHAHGDEMEKFRAPLFGLGILGTVILAALIQVIAKTQAARSARKLDEVA